MVSFPPCKINLGLHILSARPDGYHNIETCFYPVPWYDMLEIVPAKKDIFTCTGVAIPGKQEDNVCLTAYRLLKHDFDLDPVAMHLHKTIPVGAGLGGGASDAVYTLKMLNQLFTLRLTNKDLLAYALRLGSDCAYFVYEGPMLGSGRGELLSTLKISLSGKYIVLIYPNIHVSSAEAYGSITPRLPATSLRTLLTNEAIAMWKTTLINDFEESIFRKYPAFKKIKEKLYDRGAVYASMSGSGSTVFGVFDAEVSLEHDFPKTRYWSIQL